MKPVEKLQDILNNEMQQQLFYNEQSVRITDTTIRQFFVQLRDDKMMNITLLESEISKVQQGQVQLL
jgi:hypothetical protein